MSGKSKNILGNLFIGHTYLATDTQVSCCCCASVRTLEPLLPTHSTRRRERLRKHTDIERPEMFSFFLANPIA